MGGKWGQNVCVCLEEHREVFTQGLAMMAKVETHFLQPLGGFLRAGNSVLAGESPNLHPVSLNDPHNEILVRGHAPTVVAFVFSKIHNTEQPLLVLPPEHNSFGCHITKISIFWDVLRKDPHGTFVHLSPDVLTTLACQQAGSLPGWEIMSTVITEVWHS